MSANLPFRLDEGTAPYWRQIAAGFRNAIRTGHYAPGDRLPSILQIADDLGVSHIVVRQAVQALKKEGLVTARRRRGIEVSEDRQVWVGHVLFVYWETITSYHFSRFMEVMLRRLEDANLAVTLCPVNANDRKAGYPRVTSILDGYPFNATLLFGGAKELDQILGEREVPLIQVSRDDLAESAACAFQYGCDTHWHNLVVEHCRQAKIRNLGIVSARDNRDALQALLVEQGIQCELLDVDLALSDLPVQETEAAGLRTVTALIQRLSPMPDGLFFADEWLARGGMMALLSAGVLIPEELQLITVVNSGAIPACPQPFSRIEFDPAAAAETVAIAVLDVISKPQLRRPLVPFLHTLRTSPAFR